MASLTDLAARIGQDIKARLPIRRTSLTTEDLDTLVVPGVYMQQTNAAATLALHYPYAAISGDLLVMPMNEAGSLATQVFFPNNAFETGIATRSFRAGVWSPWQRFDPRSTADNLYAPIDVLAGLATPAALKVAPLALTTGYTGQAASTSRSARIPIKVNAELGRFRVHIRNWNPRLGTVVAAPVDFTGLWLAATSGSGAIAGTPTQLRGSFSTPANGDEWVSDWFDAPLGGNVERLLCYGYDTASAPWALTGGSYQAAGSGSAISGAVSAASLTAFDIWVEVETPATTPIIAGIGDSLTAGVGATLPMHESWLSQYARRVGGIPMTIAHSGDSMRGFITVNNTKYTRWKHLARADAVVWALGSNDIGSASTLAVMQEDYGTISAVVERDIGPIRYVATVQPRNGWDATVEAKRADWNAWLTSRPGIRGVLDFASVVSTDGDTIRPEFNADGTHLNTAGYKAEADSIVTPVAAPLQPVLTDSGRRDLSAALGSALASGSVYFQHKNGWNVLSFVNVTPSGTGNTFLLANNNATLRGWAPGQPGVSAGEVTEAFTMGSSGADYRRVSLNYTGGLTAFGITAGNVLNGQMVWPMNRPIPSTLPGVPA